MQYDVSNVPYYEMSSHILSMNDSFHVNVPMNALLMIVDRDIAYRTAYMMIQSFHLDDFP